MNFERLGRWLIWIGLGFILFFSIQFIFNSTGLRFATIKSDTWGQYGDVVGGFVGTIVALVGVFLLFETLSQQRIVFIRQQVETRFFELIQLHRNNVSELESKGKQGRNVVIDIKDEFHEIYDSVKLNYSLESANKTEVEWKKGCIKIAYLITFFGVDNSSTEYLRTWIREIIGGSPAYNKFIKFLETRIAAHKAQKEENRQLPREQKRYLEYDGHQSRLGHYFRHLFQKVKYINEQPNRVFNFLEKYNYVKTLRAQLSTHEQALLLYNLISPLGEPWELSSDIVDENQKLVTKYNLIKNIPLGFTGDIEPKDYFPNIYYEKDDKPPSRRITLENLYT